MVNSLYGKGRPVRKSIAISQGRDNGLDQVVTVGSGWIPDRGRTNKVNHQTGCRVRKKERHKGQL